MRLALIAIASLLSTACACSKPSLLQTSQILTASPMLEGGHTYVFECTHDTFLGFDGAIATKDGHRLPAKHPQKFVIHTDQVVTALIADGNGSCKISRD